MVAPGNAPPWRHPAGFRLSQVTCARWQGRFEEFYPTLQEKLGTPLRVPEGVNSIVEIIPSGRDQPAIAAATQAAVAAPADTLGLP
jgi:hypothetical protein